MYQYCDYRAVQNATGQRSIVISRSTYVGSGQSCGHWLGDNDSQWPHLHQSIIGNQQLFLANMQQQPVNYSINILYFTQW